MCFGVAVKWNPVSYQSLQQVDSPKLLCQDRRVDLPLTMMVDLTTHPRSRLVSLTRDQWV